MPPVAICFSHVTKRYGKTTAVHDLDFEVYSGEICGFLGPNGAGKTTTINLMLGLVYSDQGQIEMLGHRIPAELQAAMPHIGAALERPAFYPFLSGRDNLYLLAKMRGKAALDNLQAVLETVDLADRAKDKFGTYSMGMKQRLSLAAALLPNPRMLILDEPTNGLDPAGMVEIRDLLKRLSKERGKTIFLSSHLLNEAEQICDRVIIINTGSLLVQGSLLDLLGPGEDFVRLQTSNPSRVQEIIKERNCWIAPWSPDPETVWFSSLTSDTKEDVLSQLAQENIAVREERVFPKTLETLFLALTTPRFTR